MSIVYDMIFHAGECLLVSRQIVFHFFDLELSGLVFLERGHPRRIFSPNLLVYTHADRASSSEF